MLRSIGASLAIAATPRELHIYGLDFASRGLQALEALPHCGAVVAGDDEERVSRLIGRLQRTVTRRRELFAAQGATDLDDYRRRAPSAPVLPRIVVMLDNYGGFAAAHERVQFGELVQAVGRLAGEGRPLGIHFVITADRRASVPGALAGVISERLVLRMA